MRGVLLVRRCCDPPGTDTGLSSSFVEVLELQLAKAFQELLLHIYGQKEPPWQARRRKGGKIGEVRRETKRVFERLQWTERKLEVELESSVESSQNLQLRNAP